MPIKLVVGECFQGAFQMYAKRASYEVAEVTMIRGIVNRERAEWMVKMCQDDIKSRREWCDRGWISEATRDLDIANITRRMSIPLRLLGILNG